MKELQEQASSLHAKEKEVRLAANAELLGKYAVITCPYFNGQPCGRSRPPLLGKVLKIDSVFLHEGEVWVGFEEVQACLGYKNIVVQEDTVRVK